MSASLPILSVIGPGHLGRTLARLWHTAGVFRIADVVGRRAESAASAVAFIGAGRPLVAGASLQAADVYLIATPDAAIANAASALAASGMLDEDSIVFHCSGSLSSQALTAAAPAQLASIHPIRSFAQPDQAVASFAGTWCGAEGQASALERLRPAFSAIGARLVEIDSSKKSLYHAAAVIGSNYLVTLIEAALQTYEAAGIKRAEAMQMLGPLAGGALGNALRAGPAKALSGPIARGDWETVRQHEQALLAADPRLAAFYQMLAEHTAALAKLAGNQDTAGSSPAADPLGITSSTVGK